MNKQEFLKSLESKLEGLPKADITRSLEYYSEIIADRVEDGISEEEAVAEIGSIDEAASQIVADIPLTRLVREKIKPRKRLSAVEIILLLLGSPIWLSLIIAAFAVVLSLYISLWSIVISLWAVFVSLVGCFIGGVLSGILLIFTKNLFTGIAMLALGMVCSGLSILIFFGCKWITKGFLLLTKKLAVSLKNCFVKKESV